MTLKSCFNDKKTALYGILIYIESRFSGLYGISRSAPRSVPTLVLPLFHNLSSNLLHEWISSRVTINISDSV